jgi:hypothetical protein
MAFHDITFSPIIIITIPKPIFTETQTHASFRIYDLSSFNLLPKANTFVLCVFLLSCLVSELQKISLPGLEPRTVSRHCVRCSCTLLTETKNFYHGAVLLSCLLSELQKTASSRLGPRTPFWGCGLCSCNLLFEKNNFGLSAVLLSCLVSELQDPPSPGLEIRSLFPEFWIFYSLPGLKEYVCQVWCKSNYPFSSYKRTYTHTQNFNFMYDMYNIYNAKKTDVDSR